MADKGRFYPLHQLFRLYSGTAESVAGLPPEVAMFRTQFFTFGATSFASNVAIECAEILGSPGDTQIGYRSEEFTVGPHTIAVGTFGKVLTTGQMVWKYAIWEGGDDQIPWGWNDRQSHWAWFPGDVQNLFTAIPFAIPIQPNGMTEIWGKPW